ncbi:MAG: DnaD domain protein [Cellulosilyticum sp.]|nr:DnaD domain protein [Cellulosilyticum sp.]
MAYIKTNSLTTDFIQVPQWFITDYMPKALGGYTKVYLYLLALSVHPPENGISLEDVCKELDMLHSEVIQALKYWDKQMVLSFKEEGDECFDLHFTSIAPKNLDAHLEDTHKIAASKPILQQTRPEYSVDEINIYKSNSQDFTNLVKVTERYLGRLISFTDQKILYSFYDWLHMPFDLIEYLIEYCASMNRTGMHYIEKVAINWVDEGILTLEQAKAKMAVDKRYFKVLNALGASRNTLTPVDKKYMSKWFETYHFNMEIILAACEKAVTQANKPSLNYVDSILTSWFNEKVKSLEDIKALDKVFESKKLMAEGTNKGAITPLSNKVAKFNAMDSHDWDFDEIEKLEREYIERKLNGGS